MSMILTKSDCENAMRELGIMNLFYDFDYNFGTSTLTIKVPKTYMERVEQKFKWSLSAYTQVIVKEIFQDEGEMLNE